jgi:hypothetical protein
MKRRSVLRSIVTLSAVTAGRAATEKGLPAGLPPAPPGATETPNTPVAAADETADSVNRTFNTEQLSALNKLGEMIVPAWKGLPGATEAAAAEFLDFLTGCSPEARLRLYRDGLDTLNLNAQEKFGKKFAMLEAQEADTILAPLRQASEQSKSKDDALAIFLRTVKGDLLRATFNSRPYIDALSQTRRPRNASDFYWHPIG